MIVEVSTIQVLPGTEEGFIAAYRAAHPLIAGTPGCLSIRMTRGIESPARFILFVEWESVEAHERNFRASERYVQWRGLLGGHFAEPPIVEHFADVPGPSSDFFTQPS